MDQEKSDAFTISVGNIPPKANVIIKVIYITELGVDGPNIVFTLPPSVSPSKPQQGTHAAVFDLKVHNYES